MDEKANANIMKPQKSRIREISNLEMNEDAITLELENDKPIIALENPNEIIPHDKIPKIVKDSVINTYGEEFFLSKKWTIGKLKRLRRAITHPKENLTNAIAQICGPKCNIKESCPYDIIGKAPIGERCISKNSIIFNENGYPIPIYKLNIGDKIFSINENTHNITIDTITDFIDQGLKKVYIIKTFHGYILECTTNHPIYTVNGNIHNRTNPTKQNKSISIKDLPHIWQSIDDGLSINNKIAIPNILRSNNNLKIEDGAAELLGYFIGDGYSNKYQIKFYNSNKLYIDEFEKLCIKLGVKKCSITHYPPNKGTCNNKEFIRKENWEVLPLTIRKGSINPVRDIIKNFGLLNVKGPNKKLPEWIYELNTKQLGLFINRFWSADGNVTISNNKVHLSNTQENKELLIQLQLIFKRYGIQSTIKSINGKYKNNWIIIIRAFDSVTNFFKLTGLIYGKEINSKKAIELTKHSKYTHIEKDIRWDRIKSIKYKGEERVYDITLKNNSNFFANGILIHNCPVELNLAKMLTKEYIIAVSERLQKDLKDLNEDIIYHNLIKGLVESDIVENRLNSSIANNGLISEEPAAINQQTGEVYYKDEESVYLRIKDKVLSRKDKLYRQLLATPEMIAKYKNKSESDKIAQMVDVIDRISKIADDLEPSIKDGEIVK